VQRRDLIVKRIAALIEAAQGIAQTFFQEIDIQLPGCLGVGRARRNFKVIQ